MVKGSANGSPATKKSPKTTSVRKSRTPQSSVVTFALQCDNCFKWRRSATEQQFEEFRCKQSEDPFVCDKLPGISCDNPADIKYDSSRTWVMDRPNIPKTPKGFQRVGVLRRDYSKMDVKYITPDGKKIRTAPEMAAYLKRHPEFSHISPSDFCFKPPKVMRDTIPEDVVKNPASSTKKKKTSK